jgi:maleylacetoacetate isomerase
MIELYSYFRSSCSWRVRIALNMLNIPYKTYPINLLKGEQKLQKYLTVNPLGTVPAIRTEGGKIIWQSSAIIDYLDTDGILLPVDKDERARCMQISQTICSEIQPLQNLSVVSRVKELAGDQAGSDWAVFHNRSKLKTINDFLVDHDGGHCVGENVSLADLYLVPQLYSANRFGIDIKNEFPNLYRIAKSVEQLEAFKKAHPHAQPDCPEDIRKLGLFFS